MREWKRLTVFLMLVFLVQPATMTAATSAGPDDDAAPPPAAVLEELEFSDSMRWYYRSDVGMLLVHADGRLHRLDLLDDSSPELEATEFPTLSDPRSVVPLLRTGLLLIPEAPAGLLSRPGPDPAAGDAGRSTSSYAFDTLGGKLLWEAPPLPSPDVVFSFPGHGLAVMRTFEDKGRVIAVDLQTGKRTWEQSLRATIIWPERPYLRLVVGEALLALDIDTGETVRSDKLTLPKGTRLHAYPPDGVLILWKNKFLEAFAIPAAAPAEAETLRPLWEFKAAGPMINACIKKGSCFIRRVAKDRLLVWSGGGSEVLDLRSGEVLVKAKRGFFPVSLSLPPGGTHVAFAASEEMRIHDGKSGELLHKIKYPRGGEGMKTLRRVRWLGEDVVMAVFPDKKGNPRKMSAFSCEKGTLLWSVVLPEVADFDLTSKQRGQLIARIMLTVVGTAYSVGNPMSVGGVDYAVVMVPGLDVSSSLDAAAAMSRGAAARDAGADLPFATAFRRYEECERRESTSSNRFHFVAGSRGKYEILAVDLEEGVAEPRVTYGETDVHVVVPFTAFHQALSVEHDNRRIRLISLDGDAGHQL